MTEALTAKKILELLTFRSPDPSRWDGGIAPWRMIGHEDANALSEWYKEAKPKKDLRELANTSHTYTALLHEGAVAVQAINTHTLHVLKTAKTTEERDALKKQHRDDNEQLYASAGVFVEFTQHSLYGFRPKDFKGDPDCLYENHTGGRLVTFTLLHNTETGEVLSTMRDMREKDKDGFYAVTAIPVEAARGMDDDALREQARWAWSEKMLRAVRYAPFIQPEQVEAMEDATRLRHTFREAATPALPLQKTFEFFPAFRHAYDGVLGFHKALADVYGENGNMAVLEKAKRQHVRTERNGGGTMNALEIKYGIFSSHFISLYEKMNDADRADFREAFSAFTQTTLPRLEINHAHDVIMDLRWLQTVVDHGSGALSAANMPDLMDQSHDKLTALHRRAAPKSKDPVKPGW